MYLVEAGLDRSIAVKHARVARAAAVCMSTACASWRAILVLYGVFPVEDGESCVRCVS